MLNIAVCDDDIQITGKMETLLKKISRKYFIDVETEVFWKGESLTERMITENCFDIIFLDIEMGEEDGISVARRIRAVDNKVLIVYVSSHDSYMKDSFEVRPFQFLVKPVAEKQLAECFKAAYEEITREDYYFRYHYQRTNHKILLQDIMYFESCKRKVFIVTKDKTYEFYGKLNEIEKSLGNCKLTFLRVHQSFLVNYKYVFKLSYDFLELENGKNISISEERRKKISEQYCSIGDTYHVAE